MLVVLLLPIAGSGPNGAVLIRVRTIDNCVHILLALHSTLILLASSPAVSVTISSTTQYFYDPLHSEYQLVTLLPLTDPTKAIPLHLRLQPPDLSLAYQ